MQTADLPTKIYTPQPTDPARITALSQSNAPVKIYTPPIKQGQ